LTGVLHDVLLSAAAYASFRHGIQAGPGALEKTLDGLFAIEEPDEEETFGLFRVAMTENNEPAIRYLFNRLDLSRRKDVFKERDQITWLYPILSGHFGIFEAFIEHGVLHRDTRDPSTGFNPLQASCIARQRNTAFFKRLIEIGCPIDGVGGTKFSEFAAFSIAVHSGLYDIATLLLEHGADKDFISGWLGGQTPTMRLLSTWPDLPVSRLKYLLEDIPRLGFGHVNIIGWPSIRGNLFHALAMNNTGAHTSGCRLVETLKYMLSRVADKSCLNDIDGFGATTLRYAVHNGNVELCRILIRAGADVNKGGYAPLSAAKDWLVGCQKREKKAMKEEFGSERRLAVRMRLQAEETVQLLISHGAKERGLLETR
jgi:hypothetical protein